jgi:PBP1b-binding outer membrane lipoprotein LpoB
MTGFCGKKVIAFLAVFAIAFMLSGCSGGGNTVTKHDEQQFNQAPARQVPADARAKVQEMMKGSTKYRH